MTFTSYRHLAIDGAKAPPTESQLQAIEYELGAALPASFKAYLGAANGGYLEYTIDVPTGDGQVEELSFCSLFSADLGDFCDETFIGEIRSERELAGIPVGVLPFARDGGGSMVYLDLTPEGKGRVVAFVQGLPAWAGKRTDSAFIEIAASFDAYVSKLRVDTEAIIEQLERGVTELAHIEATEEWLDIGLEGWRRDVSLTNAVQAARERLGGGASRADT